VSEALHAGGRSLIFEWSRVSILSRGHIFAEIVHSPANIALLKTFNPERTPRSTSRLGRQTKSSRSSEDQHAHTHRRRWITKGKTPPHAPYISVDQNPANDGSHLALDELGNAKGGIRNVWVDVPIATYGVFGKGKTAVQDRLCLLAGTEVPLPEATLRKLYSNKDQYTGRVDRRLKELVSEGWFLPEYVDMVRAEVKASSIP